MLSFDLDTLALNQSGYFSVNIYVDLNLDLNRLSTPYKFCSSLSTALIGNPVDIGLNCFESLRFLLILIYRKHTHTYLTTNHLYTTVNPSSYLEFEMSSRNSVEPFF